jgi:hypothetical protein
LSTDPITDTATSAPVCRVVFCSPDASPDCAVGTLAMSSEVSAENAIVLAPPTSSRPAKAAGYGVAAPTQPSTAIPAAAHPNPASSITACPNRFDSGRYSARGPMALPAVSGSSASPADPGEYPRACWK